MMIFRRSFENNSRKEYEKMNKKYLWCILENIFKLLKDLTKYYILY